MAGCSTLQPLMCSCCQGPPPLWLPDPQASRICNLAQVASEAQVCPSKFVCGAVTPAGQHKIRVPTLYLDAPTTSEGVVPAGCRSFEQVAR